MWTNWSRGQACAPARLEAPRTRARVAELVASSRRVRVAGAGHSFSDAVLTDGTLLRLDALDAVLDADRASGLVRVEAGIGLRRLNAELHARGLALPNLGDIDAQSLAGALAMGTHGTGGRLPNLSGFVEGMELVLADGSERTLTAADGNALRAARVGLGALGAVVAVTLRCVPAFRLHAVDEPVALADVLADLEARVDGHDHFELWTFPHSSVAITRTNDRTPRPARPQRRARRWADEVLLENVALDALNRAGRRVPRAIPALNRLAGAASSRRERVEDSFAVFASERRVRFEEMEYAVPREHAVAALEACRAVLARHPVGFPVELRFARGDDALLSPAHGRDTAYLAAHVYRGVPFEAPLREVEAAMAAFGGRPHWGKRSWLTAAELEGRYPRWAAFAAVRRMLDPEGRFANAFTERMLGSQEAAPLAAVGRHGTGQLVAGE
jgi:L-gulono-1,4-lactone dehydrogenase